MDSIDNVQYWAESDWAMPLHVNITDELVSARSTDSHPSMFWIWDYGDGSIDTFYDRRKEVEHVYLDTGVFTVMVTHFSGYCSSFKEIVDCIVVVDAPKPGFRLLENNVCFPSLIKLVDHNSAQIIAKQYKSNKDLVWREMSLSDTVHAILLDPGEHVLHQRLVGLGGCVSVFQIKNVLIHNGYVHEHTSENNRIISFDVTKPKSFTNSMRPEKSVLQLIWRHDEIARSYNVFRNDSLIGSRPYLGEDFFQFNDTVANYNKVEYKIVGVDSCGSFEKSNSELYPFIIDCNSHESDEHLVKGSYSNLDHKPLRIQGLRLSRGVWEIDEWAQNVGEGSWESRISKFSGEGTIPYDCFKLMYVFEKDTVLSNTCCVEAPFKPFIPNAISPNSDGMNDHFSISGTGFVSYNFTVYSRWGSIVYKSQGHLDQWSPDSYSQGLYLVSIELISPSGARKYISNLLYVTDWLQLK